MVHHNIFFTLTVPFCFIGYCMAVDLENIKLLFLTMSTMAFFSFGGLANFMVFAFLTNNGTRNPGGIAPVLVQWITTIILICFIYLPFFNKKTASTTFSAT